MKKAKPYSAKDRKRLRPKNEIQWIDNPRPELVNVIDFNVPEFSHLCPITGQPDVAVIHVRFIPDKRCLETRSFMQYLWIYRNKRAFHEEIVPVIMQDVLTALRPQWLQVLGEFMVRGVTWERILSTYENPEISEAARSSAHLNRFRLQP